MADKIVSWGGFDSKGTSGMGVTGSLSVSGSGRFTNGLTVSGSVDMTGSYLLRGGNGSFVSSFNYTSSAYDFPTFYNFNDQYLFANSGNNSTVTFYNFNPSITNNGGSFANGVNTNNILGVLASYTGNGNDSFQYQNQIRIAPSVTNYRFFYARAIYFAPTLTSITYPDFRFLENTTGDSYFNTTSGVVNMGSTTSLGARLGVKGAGTTSATTAFLVQNANASASLSVLDNSKVVIGTETVSQASLYIGHNGTSGGSNGTSTVFFASQFGSNYPYRLGAEGNGYDFYLRQANGGQGSVNIDFSGLNNISYTITNTNVLNQSFATSSIIVTKSTLNSYLAIGNKGGFSNSQTDGDTPLIFFRSMTGGYYDKTVDAAVTIRNGSPTAADDNINKNTAFWYRNGYIGIGTSTSLFATNTLQGALTINQGTNTGYANRFPTTASLVNTSGLSTTVTFTPDNGNTAPSYNIIVGTIITANSASRKVTAVRFQNVTVDTAVDWSGGYPYTYRNPYISIADGSTPIFDINPSGNVGIGTSTPTASLHISGSSNSVLLEIDSPAVNNIIYVSGSGNVGIGTGTPAYKTQISLAGGSSTAISTIASTNYNLVVQNTTDLAGTYAGIGFMNPYDTQGYIGVSQVGTGYGAGGNMLFALRPSGGGTVMTEYMRLLNNGNLLLGTTTDSARLTVKGSGTTSATTAFLVQNANASGSLSVKDDGSVGIGTASPFSSGLTVANPAYTGYGRVYMNANNTFIVADNGTGGTITFGPSNRIFINSQQVSLPSGYISIGGSAIISTSGSYQGTTFSLGNFIAANIGGSTGLTIASRYTQQGAGGPNTGTVVRIIDTGIDTIAGVTNTLTMLAINPSVNTTGGTTTLRGIYYNPTISSSVGLIQHTAIETTAGSVLFNGGNVGIGTSFPSSSLHISGASAVLTLSPQDPLPTGVPTGSFAVSSSVPPKPYFYDGTVWNALY
jgi:hypothetical protein